MYSQAEGTLDINARGLGKGVPALQELFARSILKLDSLPADPKDDRVYDLAPLLRRDFSFVRDPTTGIGSVVVKSLRLSSTVKKGDRLIIEADTTSNRQAVYDLMDQVGKSIPLHLYRVTKVEMDATVVTPGGQTKTRPIRVTHPNSCSLKHDDMDEKLRQMLVASGIEPRPPASESVEVAGRKLALEVPVPAG